MIARIRGWLVAIYSLSERMNAMSAQVQKLQDDLTALDGKVKLLITAYQNLQQQVKNIDPNDPAAITAMQAKAEADAASIDALLNPPAPPAPPAP